MTIKGEKQLALRIASNRVTSPRASDPSTQIERINTLTRAGRATWIGLISFFAFVGVTLMAVEDADFFIPSHHTQLPIIGVSVPTSLFFATAPWLGLALFGYLHFHLLSLWRALGAAPATNGDAAISDTIAPWLVNDLALAHRRDGALQQQPLRFASAFVSFVLVFAATPALLFALWWWSLPAHDEALTILGIGLPATLASYFALRSWAHLRRSALRSGTAFSPWVRRSLAITLMLAVAATGWFYTEKPLAEYAAEWRGLSAQETARLKQAWWALPPWPGGLARADLRRVNFVSVPPDWLSREDHRRSFALAFCREEGLPAAVCGMNGDLDATEHARRDHARDGWCLGNLPDGVGCAGYFAAFEIRRIGAWKAARARAIATLPGIDLNHADLREADLSGARLEGANLRGARLEGADLSWARLEGANLSWARLEGADLRGARLEGANLSWARLEGADLSWARLEGADLRVARLEGADLSWAQLEGANLSGARLEGANLSWARMDPSTDFSAARVVSAALKWVDLTNIALSDAQLQSMFGDGSVILPEPRRPAHWPGADLDWEDFHEEWRRWQEDPAGYVRPEDRPR